MADQMTPEVAVAVLNAAMQGANPDKPEEPGMFPQGAIPEKDADKISEAGKIVDLASQARVVADQIGHANVPLWPVVERVLRAAGLYPGDTNGASPAPAPMPVVAAPAEPPPVPMPAAEQPAGPPPAPMPQAAQGLQAAADAVGQPMVASSFLDPPGVEYRAEPGGDGAVQVQGAITAPQATPATLPPAEPPPAMAAAAQLPAVPPPPELVAATAPNAYAPAPGSEAASWPQTDSGAHVPPEPPPQGQPVQETLPPAASEPTPSGMQEGQRWLDANGGEWDIITYKGGPQLEARSVETGEPTVLPAGFLKQPAPVQPASATAGQVAITERVDGAAEFRVPTEAALPPLDEGARVDEARPVELDPPLAQPPVQEVPPSPPSQPSPPPPPQPPVSSAALSSSPAAPSSPATPSAPEIAPMPGPGVGSPPSPPSGSASSSESPPPPSPDPAAAPAQSPADARADLAAAAHAQAFVAPIDDDEGDEKYGDLLAQVTADYTPIGMPVPMDLEREPAPMPDDLTGVGDIQARALHSQFNALAARARYLYGLEAAKARACERIFKFNLKGAMRDARQILGQSASVTEVQQLAEDNELVEPWLRRRNLHSERAEAYKTFLTFYTEDVTVLSRDWTMRDKEERGS